MHPTMMTKVMTMTPNRKMTNNPPDNADDEMVGDAAKLHRAKLKTTVAKNYSLKTGGLESENPHAGGLCARAFRLLVPAEGNATQISQSPYRCKSEPDNEKPPVGG